MHTGLSSSRNWKSKEGRKGPRRKPPLFEAYYLGKIATSPDPKLAGAAAAFLLLFSAGIKGTRGVLIRVASATKDTSSAVIPTTTSIGENSLIIFS